MLNPVLTLATASLLVALGVSAVAGPGGETSRARARSRADFTVTFDEVNGVTNVATSIKYASKADRDEAFATGMTEGMEMNYKQLDEVLAVIGD